MDIQHGHVHMYVHIHVRTCTRFFHTYMNKYAYTYVYILISSKKFVSFRFAEFFDGISPKQNKTWPWQNEILAKFR
jgi:hypothetical protein